jgi:hypothetical protein
MRRTQVDLAWMVGIFEGEGSAFLKGTVNHYEEKTVPYMKVSMIDVDVINRFHALAGFGTVYSAILNSGSTIYTWHSQDREKVPELLRAMLPRLGQRRARKVREVLKGAKPYGYKSQSMSKRDRPTKCSVKRCPKQPKAHALCSKHYTRWKRYGDTSFVKRIRVA